MSATLVTDYLFEAKPRWAGTIGAGGVAAAGTTTIPLSSAAELDNGDAYIVVINRVTPAGAKNELSAMETVIGELSGTNLINCVRGVEGTAQAYDAGTVVEILFTATHWNKLIEAWETEHNQDGTHSVANMITEGTVKDEDDMASDSATALVTQQSVKAMHDTGWSAITETLAYDSPTTITVASGAPTRYQKGDKLKLTQTTVKYFYIVGVADTVLTITGGSDYTLEDEAITSPQLSRIENPFGFPGWFNWTPSYTASGSMTFTSVATSLAIFKLTANEANIICRATGTTGGTASNTISISIPVLAVDTGSNVTGASVGDPTSISGYCFVSGSNDYLSFRRYDSSNFGLGAGRVIGVSPMSYRY